MAFFRGLPLGVLMIDTGISQWLTTPKVAPLPDAVLVDLFKGECMTADQYYSATKTAFIATSIVGGLTSLAAALAGIPHVALLSGALALTGGGAAFVTDKAWGELEEQKRLTAEMGKRVAELTGQVEAFSLQNNRLTRQVDVLTTQNGQFRANIEDLTMQNTALRQHVESLNAQIAQFTVQNETFRTLGEQFGVHLEQFRQGHVQNRDEFARKIEEFTQQLAASRSLWAQVLQSANTLRGDHATQLQQLRELVSRLTDPRNTLLRLQEHQEINRRIQEATQQLSNLSAQIALREGQLRERDQLLAELRSAHQQILSGYRQHDTALGAQIERISYLLQQTLSSVVEVVVPCDVGFGNTLAIRCEANWQQSLRFTHTPSGWKGQIPTGKAFKFVMLLGTGEVRWEKGENRCIRESARAQQEISRRPEF